MIAENFGANATYVEGLLSRFRSNPELVDESWRAYFAELLGDSTTSTPQEPSNNGEIKPQVITAAPSRAGDGRDRLGEQNDAGCRPRQRCASRRDVK